jgi:hypothetical protein
LQSIHCNEAFELMKPAPTDHSRFNIVRQTRVDTDLDRRIDSWRREQAVIPGMAEAMRLLMAKGLESDRA